MKEYIYYHTILHKSISSIVLDLNTKIIVIVNQKKEMTTSETVSSQVSD